MNNPFKRFQLIPAIDLKAGQVVRLLQGDLAQSTVYGTDPAGQAAAFERAGAAMIHVVDLDGAVSGQPCNLELIRSIRAAVQCQLDVSGGLRTIATIEQALAAGADRVALGSVVFLDQSLLMEACQRFPGRIFGSLDVRDGRVAIRGWVETSPLGIADAAALFRAARVAALIYTDIARDGTGAGVDAARYARFAQRAGVPVIASGGIATLDDIRNLRAHFADGVVGAISGRALYDGRFTLVQALAAAL